MSTYPCIRDEARKSWDEKDVHGVIQIIKKLS
jgi:hypothetical protein